MHPTLTLQFCSTYNWSSLAIKRIIPSGWTSIPSPLRKYSGLDWAMRSTHSMVPQFPPPAGGFTFKKSRVPWLRVHHLQTTIQDARLSERLREVRRHDEEKGYSPFFLGFAIVAIKACFVRSESQQDAVTFRSVFWLGIVGDVSARWRVRVVPRKGFPVSWVLSEVRTARSGGTSHLLVGGINLPAFTVSVLFFAGDPSTLTKEQKKHR